MNFSTNLKNINNIKAEENSNLLKTNEDTSNSILTKKKLFHIENEVSVNADKSSEDERLKCGSNKKAFLINSISSIKKEMYRSIYPKDKKNIGNKFLEEQNFIDAESESEFDVKNLPLMMGGEKDTKINEGVENFISETKNSEIYIPKKIEFKGKESNNFIVKKTVMNKNKRNSNNNLFNDDRKQSSTLEAIKIMLEKKFDTQNPNVKTEIQPCNSFKKINFYNNPISNFTKVTKNEYCFFERNNSLGKDLEEKRNSNYSRAYSNLSKKKYNNSFTNNITPISLRNSKMNETEEKNNNYSIANFTHNYLVKRTGRPSSIDSNGEKRIAISQTMSSINRYKQLETKYILLEDQNKMLGIEYEKAKNLNKSTLELITYWKNFYLEIMGIVLPEKQNKINFALKNYMNTPLKNELINEIKQLVLKTKKKVFDILNVAKTISFIIRSRTVRYLLYNKGDSFSLINKKTKKKVYNKNDDLDSLPPIKYLDKINMGSNKNFKIEKNNYKNEKEAKGIIGSSLRRFDEKNLSISKRIANQTFIEIKNPQSLKSIDVKGQKVNNNIYTKYNITSSQKLEIKELIPKKTKSNNSYDIPYSQTNSSELSPSKKEKVKEKEQKNFDEKLDILHKYIFYKIKAKAKNTNNNTNIISNNDNKENKENKDNREIREIKDNKGNKENKNINFFPELISPENTYKIFMNCIKNFKYEENIYKKFLNLKDLSYIKRFIKKMEKSLNEDSLPLPMSAIKSSYFHRNNTSSNNVKEKRKDFSMDDKVNKIMNTSLNSRTLSGKKQPDQRISSRIGDNSQIFKKYKEAIMNLK